MTENLDFLYQPFVGNGGSNFVIIRGSIKGQFNGLLHDLGKVHKLSFLNEINARYFIKQNKGVPTDKISEEVMRLFIKRAMDNGFS